MKNKDNNSAKKEFYQTISRDAMLLLQSLEIEDKSLNNNSLQDGETWNFVDFLGLADFDNRELNFNVNH